MAVGGEEYGAVAFAFNHGKKPLQFVLGEEGNRGAAEISAAAVGL